MPGLLIKEIDSNGLGIAEYRGGIVRIFGVIPGETVLVRKVDKKHVNYPSQILDESPYRVMPICPYFGFCGGCRLQHMRYKEQLKFKEKYVRNLFQMFDVDKFLDILPSPKIFQYRNKMEFIFSKRHDDVIVGMRMYKQFNIVIDINYCYIQHEKANKVIPLVKDYATKNKLEPYNIITHKGFLRYLVIRTSFRTSEVLVNIVTTESDKIDTDELYEILTTVSSDIALYWSINKSLSDVAYGEIMQHKGLNFIREEILGYSFKIYPYTFFQTNPLQAERMYKIILSETSGGNSALDLYTGTGTIAIIISSRYHEIIGIESQSDSIKTAYENIEDNSISNVKFINAKVEETLDKFHDKRIDTIIVDPPRAGLSKRVILQILNILPSEVVYISCNPKTQVRDIKFFVEKGYKIEKVQPIDMFPQTPHVENIAILRRDNV